MTISLLATWDYADFINLVDFLNLLAFAFSAC